MNEEIFKLESLLKSDISKLSDLNFTGVQKSLSMKSFLPVILKHHEVIENSDKLPLILKMKNTLPVKRMKHTSSIFENYNFDKPLSSYDVKELDVNIDFFRHFCLFQDYSLEELMNLVQKTFVRILKSKIGMLK